MAGGPSTDAPKLRARPGFTLLEVGLAIGVGLLLIAGGAVFYSHMIDDAGDALMRQRLADCQALIENDFTTSSALPLPATLQAQWKARRPNDCMRSPWGGNVLVTSDTSGSGLIPRPYAAPYPNGPQQDGFNANVIYYVPFPSMTTTTTMFDCASSTSATASAYAVCGNKQTVYWFFVYSGR